MALIEHEESIKYETQQLREEIGEVSNDITKWQILKQEYLDQIASYGAKVSQLRDSIEVLAKSEEALRAKIQSTEAQVKEVCAKIK